MYEAYWGLNERPFQNTPDPKYIYRSKQHEEALARLIYVIRGDMGAGALIGGFGCGKTILLRVLPYQLGGEVYRFAFVDNPRLDHVELLRMVAYRLGTLNVPKRKADILNLLERIFIRNMQDGKRTVVIIDEAHSIDDPDIFEEIRLFLNFQLEDRFLMTMILSGQQDLKSKIDNNKPLTERVTLRCYLDSLDEEDMVRYIVHRLRVAGLDRLIFDEEALGLVYEKTEGIPRRINQLCDLSLLTGFSRGADHIDGQIVQEALGLIGE